MTQRIYIKEGRDPVERYIHEDDHLAAVAEAVEQQRERSAVIAEHAAAEFWNYPNGSARIADAVREDIP